VTGLTPGIVYRLRVQARNLVGYSDYSAFANILAAEEPDAPEAPTTTISGSNVIIDRTNLIIKAL